MIGRPFGGAAEWPRPWIPGASQRNPYNATPCHRTRAPHAPPTQDRDEANHQALDRHGPQDAAPTRPPRTRRKDWQGPQTHRERCPPEGLRARLEPAAALRHTHTHLWAERARPACGLSGHCKDALCRVRRGLSDPLLCRVPCLSQSPGAFASPPRTCRSLRSCSAPALPDSARSRQTQAAALRRRRSAVRQCLRAPASAATSSQREPRKWKPPLPPTANSVLTRPRLPTRNDRVRPMHWLLPLTLVLPVAILMAAIHSAFMRWMTRQPGPAAVREPDADVLV